MGKYKDLNDYEVLYLIEENEEDAREIVFRKYKPIILNLATYYHSSAKKIGLELDDLIQEGYIGLYMAIKNYSDNKNVLFYTYATISIRSKMLNCLKMASTQKNFALNSSISLNNEIGSDEDTMLLELIGDNNSVIPEFSFESNEFEINIRNFLLQLPNQQSQVFELKLGGFSNKDIGSLLEIDSKRVSNVLFIVREKLRSYLLKS